ncbi:SoxR reducing system RseC family protein [Bacteroides heparinolyticus]|uniref:Positive regulator of sigma(E), RseC/MucC n=1 Tax=Prevotella heparinolytica TaxID=28113 RepID=A0A449I5X2_9BACE|nr:SoxR reducing system RseC family protein [Bacteroides heparinolyticus]VFB14834.1 positive regulator of sigma(E), RseC/MucC [Bacteroides heparinolyticus]
MANTIIRHQGIVENISGSHLQVRIVQTSACASCSVKGHCSSAETKEKLVDVYDVDAASYRPGDRVWVAGRLSMGAMAVLLAFILPFLVLIVSLFVLMAVRNDELFAALGSLALLIPYYYILWLNKARIGKKFSFSVLPMN